MTEAERKYYLEDIPLEQAQARLQEALAALGKDAPLGGEAISLDQALGRVTAEPVWAKLSSPHYHAAAMDGYAVLAADTLDATETRPLPLSLTTQAIPVNTGDPLPSQANAVIMIENVQFIDEQTIQIIEPVAPWQHVRMMGEDMVASQLVLPINHRIRPADIGAVAGCGHHQILVRRSPLVVIIPTGSELVSADQNPQAGQIIEYNSLVLGAQMGESGAKVERLPIVPDDQAQLHTALQTALERSPDLILVLSGSSAGSRDFTARIIETRGQLLVHGVAVRPGHPVIMGLVDETPIIGVPGYPVSAALTGEIFIQPILARWMGQPSPLAARPRLEATTTRKISSPIGDDDFVRVTLAQVGDRLLATPLNRGAGVITSLVRADALAHIPRFQEGVDMGGTLDVILYRSLGAIQATVLAMGSHDPMLDLLAQHLALHYPGSWLTSANVGSMGGLVALKRGEAHLAGSHLLDEQSGEYNVSYIQKYLPNEPLQAITFAHREQGLMVQPDNPQNITSLDDLPQVSYVNRQRGAGTRALLDYELKQRGISSEQITGYEREEYTHLAVAAAVASGIADCGMGVRHAAQALGLGFISVGWERYDLIVPRRHQDHEGVQQIISLLQTPDFQAALASQPGYRTEQTGQIQYEQ